MENILMKRANKIMDMFEAEFFNYFFEDNDFIEQIIFFGSYMKGKENTHSDIDIIIVPTNNYLREAEEDMDRIETLLGIHQDLVEGLYKKTPLDVKLQEFFNQEEQYGWTFRTGNTLATFYSFIKEEIGVIGILNRNMQISFSNI